MMRVEVYSHFFKITRFTPRISGLMFQFAYKYTHKGIVYRNGRVERQTLNTFAGKTANNQEFRFHIGQYQEFLKFLAFNHIDTSFYDLIEIPLYTPVKVKMSLKRGKVLRDYQVEAKDFVLENDVSDLHSRLITFGMGLGKTTTSLAAIAEIGCRVIVIVLAKYVAKWKSDIADNIDISTKEIMSIQGSAELKGLISQAKDGGKVCAFTVISLNTITNYIKAYEENPELCVSEADYGIAPDELCKLLGIGSIIMDESHEHLYAVFKFMMYTHVPKLIALSATFIDSDPFLSNIQHLMFPREIRKERMIDKYIKVYSMAYSFQDFFRAKIRTTEFNSNNYSHVAFERSLVHNKNKTILDNYMKLIDNLMEMGFLNDYQKGDKLAIYASSIEMCVIIVRYLKQKYKQFDIRKYTQGDPYSNAIESDIRVTTLLSLGTAVDIPNLRCVIMTMSVQSPKSNLQVLGRLRKLPDRDVKFLYLYSNDIPKHVDYHRQKVDLFADWTMSIKDFRSPILV